MRHKKRHYFANNATCYDAPAVKSAGAETKISQGAANAQVHSAENYLRRNRVALTLFKREKTIKASIRGKRLITGWDKNYFLRLISS